MAIVVALLVVVGCGGKTGTSESTQQAGQGTLPTGCESAEVRDLLAGFSRAIGESDRVAVTSYIAPRDELIRFSVGAYGSLTQPEASKHLPQAIAGRLIHFLGGEPLRLVAAQIGQEGPLAHDTRYRVSEIATAGVDFVLESDSRTVSGKVGIACASGRLYVGALAIQRGVPTQRICGRSLGAVSSEPVICTISPSRSAVLPQDSLLTPHVPAVVTEDCRRAAIEMNSSVVYCPPLVPIGPTTSQNRSSRGKVSVTASGDAYLLNFVSDSIAGIDPQQERSFRTHLGHWLVSAESPARLAFRRLTSGYGVDAVEHRRLVGVPVAIVERRANVQAIDSGHVTVAWKLGNRALAVSVHGFEHRTQAVKMAQALIAQSKDCDTDACDLVFPARNLR